MEGHRPLAVSKTLDVVLEVKHHVALPVDAALRVLQFFDLSMLIRKLLGEAHEYAIEFVAACLSSKLK